MDHTMKHFIQDLNGDDIAEVEERENTMNVTSPDTSAF